MSEDGRQSDATAAPAASRPRWPAAVAAAALAALVLAVFLPVAGFDFTHYDDDQLVVENPFIRTLAPANLAYIFTHSCGTSYYPMRLLSLAIDYQFWGDDPHGYHLTNVVIHTVNVLLVFWLVLRLMSVRASHPCAWDVAAAAMAAAIFGVHPVVVQPVAWIPGREELLMTLFALACLHFHRSAVLAYECGAGSWRTALLHGLTAAACALAVMCNVVAAAIPLIVVAYDLVLARTRSIGRLLAGNAVLWPIAAGAVVLKLIGDAGPPGPQYTGASGPTAALRLPFVADIFRQNLMSLIWPDGLTLFYPRDVPASIFSAGPLVGLVMIAGAAGLLWLLRRERTALFGIAWFLLALAPTSQVIPHHIFRADRFLYLPLAGLAVAAGGGLAHLAARGRWMRIASAAGVIVVAALAMISLRQVPLWRDGLTLFASCVERAPGSASAHACLYELLKVQGRYSEAVDHLVAAVRLEPANPVWHVDLGNARVREGRLSEAAACFREAIAIDPLSAGAHNNLGEVLGELGKVDEQIAEFREALRLKPDYAGAHNNLGLALAKQGQMEEAAAHYREAVRLSPAMAAIRLNLAVALYGLNRFEEAIGECREALRIDPALADAHVNWAAALVALGRPDEAAEHYREALRMNPNHVLAHANLALVLAEEGRLEDAVTHYRAALLTAPDNVQALSNLAWILVTAPDARLRDGTEALRLAERAAELTGRRDPAVLGVLAGAYAGVGRFVEAVTTNQQAAALAREQGQGDLARRLDARQASYEANRPYRQAP
jgi:tetratricopeptide (TPR) repeat protein